MHCTDNTGGAAIAWDTRLSERRDWILSLLESRDTTLGFSATNDGLYPLSGHLAQPAS